MAEHSAADEASLLQAIDATLRDLGRPADLTDDCAHLSGATDLVTTDTLIEGVHFDLRYDTPEQVGAQAAVQNLSDLAASGGAAGWLLFSLCLPENLARPSFVGALTRGFAQRASEHGARVVGGNLSRTPGPLTVVVAAGGALLGEAPLTRAGARTGDALFVTGLLGDAALGVLAPGLRAARHAWRPHLAAALRLAEWGRATACMDVSDGLLLDAARLARTSGVTLSLDSGRVPEGPACAAWPDRAQARRLALTGGEDYVLLFTGPAAPPGLETWPIGEVLPAQPGRPLLLDGASVTPLGFDHFAQVGSPA